MQEYEAVCALREGSSDDPILFEEYDVVYEDLREVIGAFLSAYSHPDEYKSNYYFDGAKKNINRKAALTELMSDICDAEFSMTPVIINEAVNRNEITSIANNSRSKIVSALLRNQLEPNLGLSGTGQEVSIMRSTLIRTGIWDESAGMPVINLHPQDTKLANMMGTIEQFILGARRNGAIGFDVLYDMLSLPEYHIGLRKGLIPIYLAAAMHEYRQQLIIADKYGQLAMTADTLLQINANPSAFTLAYIDWDPQKEDFISTMAEVFSAYVIEAEKTANTYDFIVNAMKRWMLSLPKFAKESKTLPSGKRVDERYLGMMKLLRQNTSSYNLLFEKLPQTFGYDEFTPGMCENIQAAKDCFDGMIDRLKQSLSAKVKAVFMPHPSDRADARASLASVIKDWCDSLDQGAFDHLFTDGTSKCLGLFKTITNDEDMFISRLAKIVTGLRLEDWDSNTSSSFIDKLNQFKASAESYKSKTGNQSESEISDYQVTFVGKDGNRTTKSFERVETSKRGMLLHNQISKALDAMGQAIPEQEKRQILVDILEKLC